MNHSKNRNRIKKLDDALGNFRGCSERLACANLLPKLKIPDYISKEPTMHGAILAIIYDPSTGDRTIDYNIQNYGLFRNRQTGEMAIRKKSGTSDWDKDWGRFDALILRQDR